MCKMAIKYYPTNYARFILTLGVRSGPRRRVRNVTITLNTSNPDVDIKTVVEDIEKLSHGRAVALKKYCGRFFTDVSCALKVEPSSSLQGMAVMSAGTNIKEKAFLNIPWLLENTTILQLENFAESVPFGVLLRNDKMEGGLAEPDTAMPAGTCKYSKIGKMNPEPDQAEIGDFDDDAGADGILGSAA